MWAMCLGDYARRPGLVECYFDVLPDFASHDDVIRWKHFPRNWPFVRGIHRSPVNSSHKGQWRGALMFSLMCAWIHGSVNTGEAGDLRRHRAHYAVTVMPCFLRPRRGWRRRGGLGRYVWLRQGWAWSCAGFTCYTCIWLVLFLWPICIVLRVLIAVLLDVLVRNDEIKMFNHIKFWGHFQMHMLKTIIKYTEYLR